MQVTFGFLLGTTAYAATIPDTMTDGREIGSTIVRNGVARTIDFTTDKSLPTANGQLADGTAAGASGPVPVYKQVGSISLDSLTSVGPGPLIAQQQLVAGFNGSVSASFTMSPSPAIVGQTVTFDGSGSSVEGAFSCRYPTLSLDWDLDGDGQIETSGTVATYVYGDAGAVPVTLRASSDCGPVDTATKVLVIEPDPKAANVDLPEIRFLYWTLPSGLVYTHVCTPDEDSGALAALAANVAPYTDTKSLPRVRLSGPVGVGDVQDPSQRGHVVYYGTSSPATVEFVNAGGLAADAEDIEEDIATVTKANTATGITVACQGPRDYIDSLRTQAASIAASIAVVP